jgi:hypothetical protein
LSLATQHRQASLRFQVTVHQRAENKAEVEDQNFSTPPKKWGSAISLLKPTQNLHRALNELPAHQLMFQGTFSTQSIHGNPKF